MLLSLYYSLVISTSSIQSVKTEITPTATIITVCAETSCASSYEGHETNSTAIGNMPEVFEIPSDDRK
jgi:hypothetical protein